MRQTTLIAALLALCLAIAPGCGGDSDGSSSTEAGTETQATTTPPAGEPPAKDTQGAQDAKGQGQGKLSPAKAKVAAKQAAKIKDTGGQKTPEGAEAAEPRAFVAPKGGDDSIQTYGEAVEGAEGEEIIAAMRSFFTALATLDYPGVCAGLTEANRESLQMFLKAKGNPGGSCEDVLEKLLLVQAAPEARRAANGSVLEARTEDDTAFVLFTPEGGEPSYFVMKEEGGAWRSTGLSTGTPFNPVG